MMLQEGNDLAAAFRRFLMAHVVSEQTPVFSPREAPEIAPPLDQD